MGGWTLNSTGINILVEDLCIADRKEFIDRLLIIASEDLVFSSGDEEEEKEEDNKEE